MAIFDSQVSVFSIEDADGNERDLSPYLFEVSGLPGPRSLDDVTALGDAGSRYTPGTESATVFIAGLYDSDAGTGPDAVLGPLRTHDDAATTFAYGPQGAGAGFVRYGGRCWVAAYGIVSRVGSQVEFEAVLRVDGTVTRDVF